MMDAKAEARAELEAERLARRAGTRTTSDRALHRRDIATARRVVVKVGSSSISGDNAEKIEPIVEALAAAHARGTEVVLVSSGAIATGMPFLLLDERPSDLATQQAAAAVGQNVLIYRYQEALRPFRIVAGQVLLTAGDLENPMHRSNARRAMERLLGLRILPIVNENDTVATHEIRFGDNDRLAALVGAAHRRRRARAAERHRVPVHAPARRARRAARSTRSRTATTCTATSSAPSSSTASAPGERRPRSLPRGWPRHPESACW